MNETFLDNNLPSGGGDSLYYPCSVLVGFIVALILQRLLFRNKKDASNYHPMAPAGMLETVQKLSGDDFPWFLLRTAKSLNTRTFRLPLPLPGTPMAVAVGDPALAREILSDKDSTKPPALYDSFNNIVAGYRNVFTTNGSFWHARRKGIAPAFAANQVQRMNTVALQTAEDWIENKLKPMGEKGLTFDVADEMIGLLLSSISQTAFEYTLSQEEINTFLMELNLCLREFLFKSSINPLRRLFGIFLPERRRAHVAAGRLHELALRMIQAYHKLDNPTKGTIIDLVMRNPCYEDDHQRAADLIVLMVGGHDTTAYSIAWILKELASNPKLQSQLRTSLAEEKDYTRVHNNQTLKKFIREGLRLHPVASGGSIRQTGRDFVSKKDGKIIPKGSCCFLSFILPLRDPSIFGDTVDKYVPDRWDEPTPEMNQAFLPFSQGKQNCVGQSLANAELHSIIPRIISEFELEMVDPGETQYFLTLKPVRTILRARPLMKTQPSSSFSPAIPHPEERNLVAQAG